MKPVAIHLDRIVLGFPDGSRLFDGLTLSVNAGQTTCLLGKSGCGKSTLLRFIAGETSHLIHGSLRFEPDTSLSLRCAWMGQDDLLLPWFSLLDNVLLGPRLRGECTVSLQDKAVELIEAAGLTGYEHSLPATLSGGMRQRVALLRTLLEERPIMLMDEPFSALDALTRMRLQSVTSRSTAGATVLLVTHDIMEALRMANRIIVLGGEPVRLISQFDIPGTAPRRPDAPEVSALYGKLLDLLLEESQ